MDRKFPKEYEAKFVAEVLARGLSAWKSVASEWGLDKWRAYRWLHRAGHRVERDRLPLNEAAFDGRMTESKAYWIGFVMADGHISPDPTRETAIVLSQSTTAHGPDGEAAIRAFAKFLKSDHKVAFGKNKRGDRHARIQIRSNRLVAALAKHGVLPKKTNREAASHGLAKNRHFWRGYVDGDGSPGLNRNTPKIEVVGSLKILEQLRAFSGETDVPMRIHHGTGQISIYGRRAVELGFRLYGKSEVAMSIKKATVLSWRSLKTKTPRRLRRGE